MYIRFSLALHLQCDPSRWTVPFQTLKERRLIPRSGAGPLFALTRETCFYLFFCHSTRTFSLSISHTPFSFSEKKRFCYKETYHFLLILVLCSLMLKKTVLYEEWIILLCCSQLLIQIVRSWYLTIYGFYSTNSGYHNTIICTINDS
jgi:hypothetical protein